MQFRASAFARAVGSLLTTVSLPAAAAITINGTTGNDLIDFSGSSEPYLIFAKKGSDTVYGSTDSDVLDGASGGDRRYGNSGDDILIGGSGNDSMYGGAENDEFRYSGTELVFDEIEGGSGFDSITGSDGADLIGRRVQPVSMDLIDLT